MSFSNLRISTCLYRFCAINPFICTMLRSHSRRYHCFRAFISACTGEEYLATREACELLPRPVICPPVIVKRKYERTRDHHLSALGRAVDNELTVSHPSRDIQTDHDDLYWSREKTLETSTKVTEFAHLCLLRCRVPLRAGVPVVFMFMQAISCEKPKISHDSHENDKDFRNQMPGS